MKINEELERLLGTEAFRQQTRTVGNSGGDGFESLLTRQLAQGGQAAGRQCRSLAAAAGAARNSSGNSGLGQGTRRQRRQCAL